MDEEGWVPITLIEDFPRVFVLICDPFIVVLVLQFSKLHKVYDLR